MTNAHFTSLDDYQDIESLNFAADAAARGVPEEMILRSLAVKSRDNARTPVQWDAGENAGFTTGTPWLRVNPNHVTINAEAAVADPDSVFHHYRRLIELRHTLPVVVHGDLRMLLPTHEQVFAYVRTLDDLRLLVVANLSGTAAVADLGADAALLDGEVVLVAGPAGAGGAIGGETSPSGTVTLAPWESWVVLSR